MSKDRLEIAVLGGTGVGTPALLFALAAACRQVTLPPLGVRLHGRAAARGQRIIAYAEATVEDIGPHRAVHARFEPDLGQALQGADAVVCQVRPGGQAGRATDEAMALAEGLPADEGLGPSGLANFLRGRKVMDRLALAWAEHAPSAPFLQLTSPLSLIVARGSKVAGRPLLGVCELPATTSAKVRRVAEPTLGALTHAHFGLNHRAWLYDFRDQDGADRTDEVVRLMKDAGALACDPVIAFRAHAVPLPYLRLFFHPEQIVVEQHAAGAVRGELLAAWGEALDAAYLAEGGVNVASVARLLGRRRMDWHAEGVIPALRRALGFDESPWVFNIVPDKGRTAVETPCACSVGTVRPVPQPPLPPIPGALHERLVAYEVRGIGSAGPPVSRRRGACAGVAPTGPGRSAGREAGSRDRAAARSRFLRLTRSLQAWRTEDNCLLIVFWLSAAFFAYTLAVYPLLMAILGRLRPRRLRKASIEPTISLIVAACNEERHIGRMMTQLREIDYPQDRLEAVVASDAGSTDSTHAIVRAHAAEGWRLIQPAPGRVGKNVSLDEAVRRTKGEILVFADATARWEADVLRGLAANFADPRIGCVSARKAYWLEDGFGPDSYRKYWQFEALVDQDPVYSVTSPMPRAACMRCAATSTRALPTI